MAGEIAVKLWWKQAQRDFISAKHSLSSKDHYVCALLCQQAAEKALKYLYLNHNSELVRIHDLVKLAKLVNAPEEVINKCAEINPVYTEVRYPEEDELPADKVNKQEAEYLIKITGEVLRWVKTQK